MGFAMHIVVALLLSLSRHLCIVRILNIYATLGFNQMPLIGCVDAHVSLVLCSKKSLSPTHIKQACGSPSRYPSLLHRG